MMRGSTNSGGGGGGGGTPGGSSGQVQYNNSGSFGGVSQATVNADGTLNSYPEVIAVTGTSKTFALTDANTIQDCSNASTQTLTVPTNASVAFPVNTTIAIEQNGAGTVVIAAAGGVTIVGGTQTSGPGSTLYIRQESANTWYIEGGVQAQQTLNGTTSGTITYSEPFQTPQFKVFYAYANAYVNNTVTNQTITFPKAFTNAPVVAANNTGLTVSASTTTLTITSPNSATSFTGNLMVVGA